MIQVRTPIVLKEDDFDEYDADNDGTVTEKEKEPVALNRLDR